MPEKEEKSILEWVKEALLEILKEGKDKPYALVTTLIIFVLIIFIIFGQPLCSLSELGKQYCWLGVLVVIFFLSLEAFIVTYISVKKN